ncbi:MAG: DUF309 domain-containing protein [Sedimentitalea sp.]
MKPPEHLPRPPHAYVPGQTPRHDEAVFASLHASVRADMDADTLARTDAWQAAWIYVAEGFFWEAHEVLEPIWMALPDKSPERHFVQALIQTANAALKLEMARPRAVVRLCDKVDAHLAACGDSAVIMGRSPDDIAKLISDLRQKMQDNA